MISNRELYSKKINQRNSNLRSTNQHLLDMDHTPNAQQMRKMIDKKSAYTTIITNFIVKYLKLIF